MPLRGSQRRPMPAGYDLANGNGGTIRQSCASGLPKVKERHLLNSQDLFEAAMAGDARRVKWSLEAHADPNAANDRVRLRALHICAAQGQSHAAQVLLEHDADVASIDNLMGLSPLSMACLAGHKEAVSLLVCASAPLDGPEGDGGTPLLRTTFRNFPEVCEILVTAGADVNAPMRSSSDPPRTREALERRNTTGDWRVVLYGTSRLLAEVLRVEGTTALHLSAAHGNMRMCQCLLDAGARAGAVDVLLRSPLMLAGERGYVQATSLLLERQASIGANIEGHSVTTLASRAGHMAVIRLLLDYGTAVNHVTWVGGSTMLHMAAHHGQGGCVSLLCEQDANVSTCLEPGGLSPLMVASARGYTDICRELITFGTDVNVEDAEGKTAWLHAACAGHAEICKLFMNFGAKERVAVATLGRRQRASCEADGKDTRPPVASTAILAGVPPSYFSSGVDGGCVRAG